MSAMYMPPAFPMYEFDDRHVAPRSAASRWLPGWQGEAGRPAEEVCLGWFDGDGRQAVVLTTRASDAGRHHDDREAKYTTARLVYAGTQVVIDGRPENPSDVFELMNDLAGEGWTWSPHDIGVDGSVLPGQVSQLTHDVAAGYVLDVDQLICFAVSTSLMEGLRLRAVGGDTDGYPVDPTGQHEFADFTEQASPIG